MVNALQLTPLRITSFQQAAALALDLNIEEEDGWTYVVMPVDTTPGRAYVMVVDAEGHIAGYL